MYVTNFLAGNVSVIDTATDAVLTTIEIDRVGTGVAVSPDGAYVYVTGYEQGVTVIETATNTVVETVVVPGVTNGIAVGPPPS